MAKSFPAYTTDQQFPFSYLRMGRQGYSPPGVVLAGDMAVSPGTGLQVQISAGEAYVQQTVARLGSFYANRGVYQIFDDSVDNPYNTITAPVTYPRVDQVIARVYDVYEQQLAGNSYWRYEWLPGTETSGANLTNLNGAAALPDNSLRLAYCLATTSMGSSWSSSNILNVAPISGFSGLVPTFLTTSGSVTIPQGAQHMIVSMQGGGGGGAGGYYSGGIYAGGGGGGGGQYITAYISLAGVSGLTATIGGGGNGGAAGSNGSAGGNTTLAGTGLTTLAAGGGGYGQVGNASNGGLGGMYGLQLGPTGNFMEVVGIGGCGWNSSTSQFPFQGAGAGIGFGGAGGAGGGNSSSVPSNATGYGNGGAGGNAGNSTDTVGAKGSDGCILITWFP